MTWLRQLFCRHSTCSWQTVQVTPTMTRTTGGCVDCGKRLPPGCDSCGR